MCKNKQPKKLTSSGHTQNASHILLKPEYEGTVPHLCLLREPDLPSTHFLPERNPGKDSMGGRTQLPHPMFVGEYRTKFPQNPCYSILVSLCVGDPYVCQLSTLTLGGAAWSSSQWLARTCKLALVSQARAPTVTAQGQTSQEVRNWEMVSPGDGTQGAANAGHGLDHCRSRFSF